ncbi:MAG TPA: hypothetical protein VLI04_17945 [Nocardioidaceae bacterium]|nr:hypothetical protein [Nocardioidaceae bacterium]
MLAPLAARLLAVLIAAATFVVLPGTARTEAALVLSSVPSQSWSVNGRVYTTLVVGDTVYVGGEFTQAVSPTGQQVARARLAAFSMTTGALLTGWRADAGSTVRALATDGNHLYVGGAFGRLGGQTHAYLGRVSLTSGQPDSTYAPATNAPVRALDLGPLGLYVGGTFTTVNGLTRNRIALVDTAQGALVPGFTGSVGGTGVFGIAVSPTSSAVYVAGQFSTVNSLSRPGVAALSSQTGATIPVSFSGAVNPTFGIDVSDDGAMIFGAGGTGANRASGWRTSDGAAVWHQSTDGDIQAIDFFDGITYFGFHDGYQLDTSVKLRAVNAYTGVLDPDFIPHFDAFWGIFAISATERGLVLGGEFTTVGGVSARGFARFPSLGQVPTPPPAAPTTYVSAAQPWRYWDRGTRPTYWNTPGFDDSAWWLGQAQFGYGDGDETTIVSFGSDATRKYLTTYFRTTFEVSQIRDTVVVHLVADDGAAVYLNGVEVVRDNLPTGVLDGSTLALVGRSGSDEAALRAFVVPREALVLGTNTIAVEVHQDRASSSDLSFALALSGL